MSDIDALGALAGGQDSELSRVAWMLRTYETMVWGRQYTSIADRINDALLRRPRAVESLPELTGDLKKTIKEAADQADRLRSLITTHHGLWLKGGTWLDLSDVEEVHCIAVTVDDFGPVLMMMEQLVCAGTLTQTQLP